MFEQQSYEYPTVATPLKEGDLFHNYEIRSWELTPRVYKILAISALLNISAVLFAAETSLLTRKGCDSPLVGSVCQVLDTVYVGSLLFGTQRDYVDAVYEKTKLGDDEDVTFVDVSKETPPLTYPEGYFQIANPEQIELAMIDNSVDDMQGFTSNNIPGIPPGIPMNRPSTGGGLFDTPQHVPKANPHVLEGTLPGANSGGNSGFGSNPALRRKRGGGGRITIPPTGPAASPTPSPEETTAENKNPTKDPNADKKVDPTEPVTDAQINKRPFVELANTINDLLDKNQIKLDSQIVIAATGKIDKKTGKFDPKSFVYQKAESPDKNLVEIVKEAIEAMNASGYLAYLKDLSGKNLSIQILQDNDNVGALIKSDLDDENKAKTISSGLNFIISAKKMAKESPNADQNDKDDLILLQNAAVTAQGKTLVIGFNLPKADLQRMIQRKLAEQKAQPKPNGTSSAKAGNNSVG